MNYVVRDFIGFLSLVVYNGVFLVKGTAMLRLLIILAIIPFWVAGQAKAPDLVLLTEYQPQDVTGWLVSEKLDGVRAYWDGKQLVSRQGNVFNPPNWFTKNLPPFELDGELWIGRGQFEQTLSIVRRQQPTDDWRQVGFYIFEVPNQPGGLMARLSKLEHYLIHQPVKHLHIIQQTPLRPLNDLDKMLAQSVEQGAEGLVLREPNQPYHTGRSPFALKMKPKYDAECTVTGYTEGQGKYEGMVGALLCINEQNQLLRLGSGLSDAMRADPPAIGTPITYQYNGYTRNGWPRHAVFLRQRAEGF